MTSLSPFALTDLPSTEVLPDGQKLSARLSLVVSSGPSAGATLPLEPGSYRVGKGDGCDLVLEDSSVSRAHLEVQVLRDGVLLRDLDSTNGSFCQGTRFREIVATPGAVIAIGKSTLRLQVTSSGAGLQPSSNESFGRLFGRSLPMRAAFSLLERVAPTDVSVILEGETGTGKELCAEAIHASSPRKGGPLVIVDLAGVPANLIESELFGHVRGSFTDAIADRAGAFERAHGGTVFLDEIGELPLELQPRLLRALESRTTKRVGSNDYAPFDVRVVCATHRDLKALIAAGKFRDDLYHRLAVVKIGLPPLRARREDIPLLVERLLVAQGHPGTLGPQTMAALAGYDWPGNVRELRNVVERVISLGGGAQEVPVELLGLHSPESEAGGVAVGFKEAREQRLSAFERDYLASLLERCHHNVSQVAREAGLDRVSVYRLLKKHGLSPRGC